MELNRELGMKANSILLIEDNPDDEELTIRALKKDHKQAKVEVARDGKQAVEMLFPENPVASVSDVVPVVILLDLNIPKMNGLEVLRRIRSSEHTKKIPVVVLTGSDVQKDVDSCYALGVNSFVKKPNNVEGFINLVRQIASYWTRLNEVIDD